MAGHLFDAVIFDLDGVITKTALVHSVAWTSMFNDYLAYREKKYGETFREFNHEADYLPFVDGKPRYKGVDDFLSSRGIRIPFGDPSDPVEAETVCGLGNRKNVYFNEILERDGVEVYESTIRLLEELKKEKIRIGVASSSKNCRKVLNSAGLMHFFETRVDGEVSAEIGLKGKPEPDIFTTACDRLGVAYDRAVVVEDAVSGVQAGAKGGFGLTLGLDREGNREALEKNGADFVLNDISELGGIDAIDKWFEKKLPELKWNLVYKDFDPEKEKSREALLTVGNGFFATRGCFEEAKAGNFSYPGSYMTGLYNRRKSKVGDRFIENEDFVNFINWLPVNFRRLSEDWFDPSRDNFRLNERKLDLKNGILYRDMVLVHPDARETRIESRRFISMDNPHLAGIDYRITPLNYSEEIELRSGLDAGIINDGVARYRELDQKHIDVTDHGRMNGAAFISVRTNQSDINIVVAEKSEVISADQKVEPSDFKAGETSVDTYFKLRLKEGESASLRKYVSIHNSRDFEDRIPLAAAIDDLGKFTDFEKELGKSCKAWSAIWEKADLRIEGDRLSQVLLRMHIYHLFVTASLHHNRLDAGIPARGLHGEAYRGHIFWDELYVLPMYISSFPEIARSVLMYRYRRLDAAREYARNHGYRGAMFPWQSGSDGREETQVYHLNPVSGKWGDDYSSLQRHISIAIAYNIWQYYQISGDQEFMDQYGAEMFFEICRFWASTAKHDEKTGRFSIEKVMGPDEFHEKLPGSAEGGLKDNAYTNLMTVWCMERAFDIFGQLEISERQRIVEKIGLAKEELVNWKAITMKMNVSVDSGGVIEQFHSYFGLKELDWEAYRAKYGNIHRLDRILKAEGKSPDHFKLAKQADLLMLYYNLGEEETENILNQLGYERKDKRLKLNFDYYLGRTSHGSTLSRIVHARLAMKTGNDSLCRKMYFDALASDYNDIQGGTTGEGIHVGVMGGTIVNAITVFAGLDWQGESLKIEPALPPNWKRMEFHFLFRKNLYYFQISREEIHIQCSISGDSPVRIYSGGLPYELENEKDLRIRIK